MMMTPWRSALLAMLLSLLTAMAATAKTPGEVEVGSVLREAVLRGLNGPDRKFSDFRGKPLLINVWASWCPPCLQEMSSLERLAWTDVGQQFTVIGISTDDDPEAAKRVLRKTQATLNHYIDVRLNLEHMLGADRLPLTVLVDAKGRVLHKVVGAREWDSPQALQLINQTFHLRPTGTSLIKP